MISLYKYQIPFTTPFSNANRSYRYRKGIIIRFMDEDTDLVSEAAPLPGFSQEDMQNIIGILTDKKNAINQHLIRFSTFKEGSEFLNNHHFPPSISFALSCLMFDLVKTRNPDEFGQSVLNHPAKQINVNGVIGIGEINETLQNIQRLYQSGYRTVKLKVDTRADILSGLIKQASGRYPGLKFRIDANQSWTINRAYELLGSLEGLPVEFCEEPCRFENFSQISDLNRKSPVPVALDESITGLDQLREIISANVVNFVIIKPTLLGNLFNLIETFCGKNTHSIKRICTTTLESGIGRKAVSRLAAVIGTNELAHGLSTGTLYGTDLIQFPEIKHGSIKVNSDTGWCTRFSECRKDCLKMLEI
jgi:o-succinylbenzoate synthase